MTETQEATKDRDFWVRLGKPYGWRLLGFSYRESATFLTQDRLTIRIDSGILQALLMHRMELLDC